MQTVKVKLKKCFYYRIPLEMQLNEILSIFIKDLPGWCDSVD